MGSNGTPAIPDFVIQVAGSLYFFTYHESVKCTSNLYIVVIDIIGVSSIIYRVDDIESGDISFLTIRIV